MTLSPTERAALRQQWLAEIDAEIERRQAAALEAAGGDPGAQLLAKLAEMGERMRAAPDYHPRKTSRRWPRSRPGSPSSESARPPTPAAP